MSQTLPTNAKLPWLSNVTQAKDYAALQSLQDNARAAGCHDLIFNNESDASILAMASRVKESYTESLRACSAAAADMNSSGILSAETYGQSLPTSSGVMQYEGAKRQKLSRDLEDLNSPGSRSPSIQTNTAMDLRDMTAGILSAEMYGQSPSEVEYNEGRISQDREATNSSDSRVQRRRSAKVGKTDGVADRARAEKGYFARYGIEPAEETAPPSASPSSKTNSNAATTTSDKRRQQMRLAQRNYRLRREATISKLAARNKVLEEVVEGMTKSFMTLQDLAMKCEPLQRIPKVTKQMQISSEEFLAWAKMVREGAEEEEDGDEGERNGAADAGGGGGEREDVRDAEASNSWTGRREGVGGEKTVVDGGGDEAGKRSGSGSVNTLDTKTFRGLSREVWQF